MTTKRTSIHGQWSSRWVFVLAATGSAVGLGNIWKFPYITGENGGGAFVLIYLVCIACIGIPIMMAEVMLGRLGRQSPINTMRTLAQEGKHDKRWEWLGWMGVLAGFLILSYYSVIAGWALSYVFRTASGAFMGATADGVSSIFSQFVSNPESVLAWHTIFMVMTMVVVSRGVRGGLEKAVTYLMPALFGILLILVGYAASTTGHFTEGFDFLFNSDFSKITKDSVLTAMGHAFFTLSLGMGAIMIYGSYLPQDASIAKTSIMVSLADTLVALLAGLAIFPIVFANGLEPGSGPGLIFNTLPIAFGHMEGGTFFGTLFFLLLVFAAWTSSISLIEPAVAWLVENHGYNRLNASVWTGIVTWSVGLLTVLSFNEWKFSFPFLGQNKENGFFDIVDILTANIMLPVGGLMIAIYASRFLSRKHSVEELGMGEGDAYKVWHLLVSYVTPIAVIIVLINALNIVPFLKQIF